MELANDQILDFEIYIITIISLTSPCLYVYSNIDSPNVNFHLNIEKLNYAQTMNHTSFIKDFGKCNDINTKKNCV
jgi:hypothetical protein